MFAVRERAVNAPPVRAASVNRTSSARRVFWERDAETIAFPFRKGTSRP
jgi:ribose 5-phosphate isomerase RpiB